MNYQLLIESYIFGQSLDNNEIEMLCIELDNQISNLSISLNLGCLAKAPIHICEALNLKKNSLWITCLAQLIDSHKNSNNPKTKLAEVHDLLLSHGLLID